MDSSDDGLLLTSRQVAELLKVHPKHIYRLLKRGLPGRRVGGEWRFLRDEVLAWVAGEGRAVSESSAAAGAPSPPATEPAPQRLLAANGDLVVHALLGLLNAGREPPWGFVQADRESALRWLGERRVLAAGSHGALPPPRVSAWRLARIHLVTREVGLIGRPGATVPALAALHGLKVASRPRTAGLYVHLIDALRSARVPVERALARATAYGSHREVACAVLRGEADVGLTTRAWAVECGLPFRKLAVESYGLLVRSVDLGEPAVVTLCEVAQSEAFRAALKGVRGYDPAQAGDIRYDPDGPA